MEILKRIWPVAALFLIITGIILTDSPEKRAASDRKAASGAASEALSEERYPMTVSFFSLDTVCTLTAYEGGGREALEEAGRELERYDRLFDPYEEGSDIYRINHREEESVRISRETGDLLQFGRDLGELSGGDLDITVGNLTALWDIRHRTEAPEPEAVAEALALCDPDGYEILEEGEEAVFRTEDPELRIDPGAIAKGYVADRLKELLQSHGVSSGIINLGGNVLCIGSLPDGEAFRIGLRDPREGSEEELEVLQVRDSSVVTAGIYERYFEADGIHYHHILSKTDGYPVQNDLAAVSVVGPDSAVCDALATTLFIKGAEEGSTWLSDLNEAVGVGAVAGVSGSYEAYFIGKDGKIKEAGR